jgi:crotonobetainyl-CoA:carnitine CoA-transferase CaiB-like acyl-CoA transferase
VNTAEDIAKDPHLADRCFFVDVQHPDLGAALKYPGPPYRLSETPWEAGRRAPLLGEDNGQVYGLELGLSATEIQALRAEGVI